MNGLHPYQTKRKPRSTPEPMGGKPTESQFPVFVVQKHAASHLHYDFRLEAAGVMKSWAVPKGPSLNPKDKRLAMMVEDHPLDYRTFEGIIPPGNYGAGTVMVWDEGVFTINGFKDRQSVEKELIKGLHRGHLDFILDGKKLKGEFSLTKIKREGDTKDNSWLLVKKRDTYASNQDVTKLERSVQTNRTMDEIANGISSDTGELLKKRAKAKSLPLIRPMLATLVDAPFNRADWIFEIKWDGYRAIAQLDTGKVFLYSRNQKSFNANFPTIVNALQKFNVTTAILDGELVILDKAGKPNFQLMQNYQRTQVGDIVYYVFDLLFLDQRDLCSLPLLERKKILKKLISKNDSPYIRFSDHVEEKGIALFKEISKQNLEGVIGKNGQSKYQMRRSKDWVKIKTHLRQEAVIGGFTKPRGSRKKFGALLLGVYENGKLNYIGHVGTGFDEKLLTDILTQMEPLKQEKSAFKVPPKANMPVSWIKPKLVCEVEFTEWTSEGNMRHPTFKGMRTDKNPQEVKREPIHPVEDILYG